MQIDVGAYIADLLYEHDVVNIPGLGGLVAKYKSAAIDQVQGKIHPPSKDLGFNGNLVVNDGLLVNYVKEKHQLSYGDALKAVEEYVKEVKETIARREIVVFPNVGRLYMDYEKNLQFLPDNTNFNTDVYGLPTVQFYPVMRSERSTAQAVKPGTTARENIESKTVLSNQISKWFQEYLPYIGGVSVILVGLGLYFTFFNDSPELPKNIQKVPASKLNVSPSLEEDELADNQTDTDEAAIAVVPNDPADAVDEEENTSDEPFADEITEEEQGNADLDTEEATPSPGQKAARIIIGSFGNEDNVKRLIKRIYEKGYEPYTEKAGRLTRVGVQMAYDEESEARKALQAIRKEFDKNAKLVLE